MAMDDSTLYDFYCSSCDSPDSIYPCTYCNAVTYCSIEHRDRDFFEHVGRCEALVAERKEYETSKSELPIDLVSILRGADRSAMSDTHKQILERYVQSRINYSRALTSAPNAPAAKRRVHLLKKALLMCPSDPNVHCTLRPLLGLMFMFEDDAETYRFIIEYTYLLSAHYKVAKGDESYYKGLNAHNDFDMVRDTPTQISIRVAFVILKLRVIAEMEAMKLLPDHGLREVPYKLKYKPHFAFLKSYATWGAQGCTMSESDHKTLLDDIVKQTRWLIVSVLQHSPMAWPYLYLVNTPPSHFYPETDQDSHAMVLSLRGYLRDPVKKTPNACQFIQRVVAENPVRAQHGCKLEPELVEKIDMRDILTELR